MRKIDACKTQKSRRTYLIQSGGFLSAILGTIPAIVSLITLLTRKK